MMNVYEKIYQVAKKYQSDEEYKESLHNTPATILRDEGFYVPPQREVNIAANNEQTFHVTIPSKEEASRMGNREMRGSELKEVVGGFAQANGYREWYQTAHYMALYDTTAS